jgi:hypothetical protein
MLMASRTVPWFQTGAPTWFSTSSLLEYDGRILPWVSGQLSLHTPGCRGVDTEDCVDGERHARCAVMGQRISRTIGDLVFRFFPLIRLASNRGGVVRRSGKIAKVVSRGTEDVCDATPASSQP